ncbi:SDR family NAD(P)-dependent oxidoreductase [Pseudomonas sp. D47]|uniref:SDR family NAD(P)-dependent oxidoreductase n=1 Tax=Pseudomonas sp. D47 TaxID=3159447 RepID=UPI00387ABCBE
MKKCVLVTGGSRGIGFAAAQYFASRGMDLILLSRDLDSLQLARSRIVSAYPGTIVKIHAVDMRNPQEVDKEMVRLLRENPPVDILVNSAGVLEVGRTSFIVETLSAMQSINVISTILVTNHVAEQMKQRNSGHIFTMASLAGVQNKGKLAAYASSKAAIISYSDALYKDLLQFNVNVTCLCPSVVNTDMTNDGVISNSDKIQVEDIVMAINFVLSLGDNALVPKLDMHCKVLACKAAHL